MSTCATCGTEITTDMAFCPNCGSPAPVAQPAPQQTAYQTPAPAQAANTQASPSGQTNWQNPQTPPVNFGNQTNPQSHPVDLNAAVYTKDHTAEFSAQDISDNKVYALLAYLLGIFGVIVVGLVARDSKFAMFHMRQSAKLVVVEWLFGLITALLFWTVIVPIAYFIFIIVLAVVEIICIVNVCKGKAKEAPIVSSFGFLK